MMRKTLLLKLFEATCGNQSIEVLQALADSHHLIEAEADSLADTLEFIALAMNSRDDSAKPLESQLASILSGLAQRAAEISAMTNIMGDAQCLADQAKALGKRED